MILCLYRKQEINFKIFDGELSTLMEKLSKGGHPMLVVGDFNVWVDVDGDKDAERLLDIMSSFGLMQSIKEPTNRSGHTLDHLYTNPYQLNIQHTVVNDQLGLKTDHLPIQVQIPNSKAEPKIRTVQYRKMKDVDVGMFRNDLKG